MNNIVWCNRLSELDHDSFIISKDLNSTGSKAFAQIKMSRVADLLRSTPKDRRVYYERIHPNKRQKPFFDIDGQRPTTGKFNETKFLEMYLNSIDTALANKGIYEGYRLIVCSSSTDTKISYHIVIDGVYVPNISTNGQFCHHVINTFDRLYPKEDCMIDNAVYTKNRMFRLLYCHKYNSKDRMKRLITYTWRNRIHNYKCKTAQDNMLLTMVSYVSKDTVKKIEYPHTQVTKSVQLLSTELDSYDIEELYSLYTAFAKDNSMDVMEIRESDNNCIKLKRSKPSNCIICNRRHSRENAYLLVRRGQLLYKCYRDNTTSTLIANLDSDTRDDDDIFEDEDDVQDGDTADTVTND